MPELFSLPELFDLDYGDFAEDLPFYENLARRCEGPILELGVGTGRVAIPLARAGFAVWGIDASGAMVAPPPRPPGARAGGGPPRPPGPHDGARGLPGTGETVVKLRSVRADPARQVQHETHLY